MAPVVRHLAVARFAEGLGVPCNTANNNAVLAEGQRALIDDLTRRQVRDGDIDLTPVRDKTGPVRLLDLAGAYSTQAFQRWLVDRGPARRRNRGRRGGRLRRLQDRDHM